MSASQKGTTGAQEEQQEQCAEEQLPLVTGHYRQEAAAGGAVSVSEGHAGGRLASWPCRCRRHHHRAAPASLVGHAEPSGLTPIIIDSVSTTITASGMLLAAASRHEKKTTVLLEHDDRRHWPPPRRTIGLRLLVRVPLCRPIVAPRRHACCVRADRIKRWVAAGAATDNERQHAAARRTPDAAPPPHIFLRLSSLACRSISSPAPPPPAPIGSAIACGCAATGAPTAGVDPGALTSCAEKLQPISSSTCRAARKRQRLAPGQRGTQGAVRAREGSGDGPGSRALRSPPGKTRGEWRRGQRHNRE